MAVMYFAYNYSKKVSIVIDNLILRVMNKKEPVENKDKQSKSALNSSIAVLLLICMMFIPVVQGHGGVHRTEEGEGFDAPMRMLFDIEDTDFWVEFMIYPPKALGSTEIIVFPVEETANVSDVWIEVIYNDEKGETTLINNLKNYLVEIYGFQP